MKRRYVLPVLALLGVLIAAAVIVADNRPATVLPAPVQPSQPPYDSFVAGTGVIEAATTNIAVGTPVSGVVTAIYVHPGEVVAKDHALFKIDDRDLQAELVKARAAIETAAASLQKPEHQLAYEESLRQRDPTAVSTQALSDLRDDVAAAKAALGSARAEVQRIMLDVERHTVRAAMRGTVLQMNMRLGEYIEAGESVAPMMILGDTSTLQLRVDVDQYDAWRVRSGAQAVAFDPGNTTLRVPLQFEYVEPLVVPKTALTGRSTERVDTRVLQVVYSFRPDGLPLYPGQQMDVYIEAPPAEPAGTAARQ